MMYQTKMLQRRQKPKAMDDGHIKVQKKSLPKGQDGNTNETKKYNSPTIFNSIWGFLT